MSNKKPLMADVERMRSAPSHSERPARVAPFAQATAALALLGFAAQAAAQNQASSGMEVFETFTATGQGESRANNSLNLEALEIAMPGATPEKMVDKIPGVNVVTRDPFGFYEFGNDVRVRAFSIENLGVTLDRVPVGNSDPRYGTPIGRLVDTPNLQTVKVSQGAGDVTTPAYQALGGSLQYLTKDPSLEPGAYVSLTVGSFDHVSLFGKYEFGEIYPGLTGYVSGSKFEFAPRGLEGLAKGEAERYEAKLKYDFPSDAVTARYAFSWNDRDDFDTAGLDWQEWQDAEAGNYRGTGFGYREFTPWDFPGISGGSFQYGDLSDRGRNLGPVKYLDPTVGPGEGTNAIYFDKWRNGRMDAFHRVSFDFEIDANQQLSVATYYQDKNNYGLWGRDKDFAETQIRAAFQADPSRTDIWGQLFYDESGNALSSEGEIVEEFSSEHAIAAPTVEPGGEFVPGVPGRTARDEEFGGYRYGASASYTIDTERNKLNFGGWYEFDWHSTVRPNFNLAGGSVRGEFLYDQFNFMNYTRFIDTDVTQFWAQNTHTALDGKLDVIFGVKALELDRNARGFLTISEWINNTETFRSVSYSDYFLPQLGLLYGLSDSTEVFFNYSENMATPNSGTITTAGETFNPDILKPEYSDNYDIGIRGSLGAASYTVQAYYIEYTDRILASAVPIDSPLAGAAGNSVFQNVGGVDSWGFEASGEFPTQVEGLSFTGSFAVQETTFAEDLFDSFTSSAEAPVGFRTEPNPDAAGTDDAFLLFQDLEGNDLGNTPFLTANFDAVYRKGQFRYTLGGKYFDDVYVNTLNTQKVESYTVFDASVSYAGKADTALEGWRATVNVSNLFDEYFWLARSYSDTDGQVLADRGRNITLKLETTF